MATRDCSYSVERHGECVYIRGSVPLDDMSVLRGLAPAGSICSAALARMTGCSLVFGLQECIDRQIAKLTPATIARYELLFRHAGLCRAAIEWLAIGQRCRAADHLFFQLIGVRPDGLDDSIAVTHPTDAREWLCCDSLLNRLPHIEERLHWIRHISPEWAAIIDSWPTLRKVHGDHGSGRLAESLRAILQAAAGTQPRSLHLLHEDRSPTRVAAFAAGLQTANGGRVAELEAAA